MAILGGSIALWRFPRRSENVSHADYVLPDIGLEIVPEFCPKWNGQNIQSWVLILFYTYLFFRGLFHPEGRTVWSRFFICNSLMFITRTTVVGVTSLPNPNVAENCLKVETVDMTFPEALKAVAWAGLSAFFYGSDEEGEGTIDSDDMPLIGGFRFPPGACGDLVFSGHTACTVMSLYLFLLTPNFMPHITVKLVMLASCFAAIGSIFACRSHYTVDVVLGLYFAYGLTNFYILRVQGHIDDVFTKIFRYCEGLDIEDIRKNGNCGNCSDSETAENSDNDSSLERLSLEEGNNNV